MALRRSVVLEFGGFDGSICPSAEDNDFSYRWLRAGRHIRYEPDFVVWHHDWRTREQLERLYVGYGIGQGMVYGKHLRRVMSSSCGTSPRPSIRLREVSPHASCGARRRSLTPGSGCCAAYRLGSCAAGEPLVRSR